MADTASLPNPEVDVAPRPAWLTPLSDPRNEQILLAAFHLFVEKGLHGASMADVAALARVSKETIYDRFENKEGLFYAIVAWGGRQATIDPDTYGPEKLADPIAALEDYASTTWEKMTRAEAIEVTRIAFGEAGRHPEIAQEFQHLVTASGREILTRIAAALNAKGLARIDDAEEFEHAVIGMLKGCRFQELILGTAQTPTEEEARAWAKRAVGRILRAFAP